MLIDVISVRVLPEFQLDLEFKNGERRKFDMRPLLSMKPWNRIATPSCLGVCELITVLLSGLEKLMSLLKRFMLIQCRC